MTFYFETENNVSLDIPCEEIFKKVAERTLDYLECPYEATVNLLLTDDKAIQEMNNENREIDASTDVLSFPMLNFSEPGNFDDAIGNDMTCFEPDSGELILGDIVISAEHCKKQSEEYGHSLEREFAFLTAHSMLHLSGFDHMQEEEEKIMFRKQEEILLSLGITR